MQNLVLEQLTSEGQSARQIAQNLKLLKKDVNRILYSLFKGDHGVVKTDGTPPLWSTATMTEPTTETLPVFIIDLGNVHNVLSEVEKYAINNVARVYAFADLAYNGYGVNPAVNEKINVFQADTADANAADTELVWKVSELLHEPNPPKNIYIFTKDQGFRRLEAIGKRYDCEIVFETEWSDDIRNEIE